MPVFALRSPVPLRLTATDLPAVVDPFGLHFTMESRDGPVRCHVFREAVDELEESHARTGAEMLRRFTVHRRRLEPACTAPATRRRGSTSRICCSACRRTRGTMIEGMNLSTIRRSPECVADPLYDHVAAHGPIVEYIGVGYDGDAPNPGERGHAP